MEAVSLEAIRYQLSKGCLAIFLAEDDVKVAFTVTDTFLSLGLFKPDGIYDTTLDLINTEERAIRWGIELFEYYQGGAKKYEV